jgi:hypothetical protein
VRYGISFLQGYTLPEDSAVNHTGKSERKFLDFFALGNPDIEAAFAVVDDFDIVQATRLSGFQSLHDWGEQ